MTMLWIIFKCIPNKHKTLSITSVQRRSNAFDVVQHCTNVMGPKVVAVDIVEPPNDSVSVYGHG